jgi:hypothetical protein
LSKNSQRGRYPYECRTAHRQQRQQRRQHAEHHRRGQAGDGEADADQDALQHAVTLVPNTMARVTLRSAGEQPIFARLRPGDERRARSDHEVAVAQEKEQ